MGTTCVQKRAHKAQAGFSLITMALFIMLLGMMVVAGSILVERWTDKKRQVEVTEQLALLEGNLRSYVTLNGRYPCPAPLDAPLDSATFGVEVPAPCNDGDHQGTFRSQGSDERMVRVGAMPVRTLGLPDEMIADPWGSRYVYALTEAYGMEDAPIGSDEGGITISDREGHNASTREGNLVYLMISQGPDKRGAYSRDGVLIAPCDPNALAGANCDHDANFTQTLTRSAANDQTSFTHRVTYGSVATRPSCTEQVNASGMTPGDVSYLVDTSGSMSAQEQGNCPPEMQPRCSRIEIVRWALRRLIPARMVQNEQMKEDERGATQLTGFVGTSQSAVDGGLNNIAIEDMGGAEQKIEKLCPSGSTPLGMHIEALANKMGDGTPERPNVVLVISDGASNVGKNPVDVAKDIANKYPNLQVHIVDVVGNPHLAQVAQITGGQYYLSKDSDKLLQSLYSLSGVCPDTPLPEPIQDKPGCGSVNR